MRLRSKRLIAIGVLLNIAALVALFWLVLDMRSDKNTDVLIPFRSGSQEDTYRDFFQERRDREALDALVDAATWESQERIFERGRR